MNDIHAKNIGIIGDHAHIEGGIHFHTHSTSTGIPLQRPPRAEHFTDRETELAQLLSDLLPGRVVTLCGPGGIGKTALAAQALWTLAPADAPPERFPDGVIFHSFYGRPDIALAFEHIIRSFDQTARDTSVEAVRRALSSKRALLILDGTEQANDLQRLLQLRDACGVLVTSRQRRDALDERQDIRPLITDEALKLLRAWDGDQTADETPTRRICELVGGLPLAVRLVGRYLEQTGETASEYLAWLEETPFEALDPDEEQHRLESVPYLLERSLAQMSDTARDILALAGQLALMPFNKQVLVEALQLPTASLKRALRQLTDYGLLLRSGDCYETSHVLVHTYARRRIPATDETVQRLTAYYTQLAEVESAKGLPGYRRLDIERPHLIRILAGCVEREEWEAVKGLAWALSNENSFLWMQGYWTDLLEAIKSGLSASRKLNYRRDEGAFLGNLGTIYRDLGQVERGIDYFEQALAIAQEIGNRQDEGIQLGNLGLIYSDLGQVERGIDYYEQALAIAQEIGDRQSEGIQFGNLGLIYSDLGQVKRGIDYYEQALAIAQEIGDRRGEGYRLGNLGIAYARLGQVERGIDYFEQALAIAQEIGHRQNEGGWLGCLGSACYSLRQVEADGDRPGAIDYYEQALAIAQEIGHRANEGAWLGSLGSAYYSLGQVERAIDYYEQALAIIQEIGNRQGEGIDLSNLGTIYLRLGQVERAINYYEQALAIAQEIGDRRGEGYRLGKLGTAYCITGNRQKSLEMLKDAVSILEEIGSPDAFILRAQLPWVTNRLLFPLGRLLVLLAQGLSGTALARSLPRQVREIAQQEASQWCKLSRKPHVDYERGIVPPNAQTDAEQVVQIKARIDQGEQANNQ